MCRCRRDRVTACPVFRRPRRFRRETGREREREKREREKSVQATVASPNLTPSCGTHSGGWGRWGGGAVRPPQRCVYCNKPSGLGRAWIGLCSCAGQPSESQSLPEPGPQAPGPGLPGPARPTTDQAQILPDVAHAPGRDRCARGPGRAVATRHDACAGVT